MAGFFPSLPDMAQGGIPPVRKEFFWDNGLGDICRVGMWSGDAFTVVWKRDTLVRTGHFVNLMSEGRQSDFILVLGRSLFDGFFNRLQRLL